MKSFSILVVLRASWLEHQTIRRPYEPSLGCQRQLNTDDGATAERVFRASRWIEAQSDSNDR